MMENQQAAILIPTYRTTKEVLANLSYITTCSNPELPVYISDNSADPEKHRFLKKLASIHPDVVLLLNKENIGAFPNIINLLDASKEKSILAFTTDDDRISLSYITRGIQDLRLNANVARSAGMLLRIQADGKISEDTSESLSDSPDHRFSEFFNPNSFNQIFYSPFRRKDIQSWLDFCLEHPLHGPFFDFLLTLCTLSAGKFLRHREGHYIYFSENWDEPSVNQNSRVRAYEALGLPAAFSLFHDLHFGVECLNFLLGKHSPIKEKDTAMKCARITWQRCTGRFALAYRSQREQYINVFAGAPQIIEAADLLSSDKQISIEIILDSFINLLECFSVPISQRYLLYIKSNYSNE
jgi:hypothetical protein